MCDFDCEVDSALDSAFDMNETLDSSEDFSEDVGATELDSLSDVGDDSIASEAIEYLQDMEIPFETDSTETTEEYPALAEYDDLINQTNSIDELENIRERLVGGEFSEDTISNEDIPLLSEFEDVQPELTLSEEILQELREENVENPEFGEKMDELISSGRVAISDLEDIEELDGGDGKVLTREITPEIIESRERDTEEVLENYRENLRERGVSEDDIEGFIEQERDSINAEYASLDEGKASENIYQMPMDWDSVAEELNDTTDDITITGYEGNELVRENIEMNEDSFIGDDRLDEYSGGKQSARSIEEIETDNSLLEVENEFFEVPESDVEEGLSDEIEGNDWSQEEFHAEDEVENFDEETFLGDNLDEENISFDGDMTIDSGQDGVNEDLSGVHELEIDYDEIYEEISQESLEQGFEDIDIYGNIERLDASLANFEADNWERMSIEDQKQSIKDLAEYVDDVIGFETPPRIEYYNNPREGDYGGYNSRTNTLSINEFMLYNNSEAADTVAHELWHAHQHECAENPQEARDYQYQYNFENYIRPELGHEAYENQLVEAEARAFASQFKGRLAELNTRRR